ncbi:MAG TPA: neprosin family prolyl endopeptidase, partial [Myxococcaceae bacterium]|nr:neprosin family prolyl endopeptidase [Myxococcaceae bacterium]
ERCQAHGCWTWAGLGERRAITAAAARLDVFRPEVGAGEHSLAEIAVRAGSELRDVMEIGWTVSPRQRLDGRPILFVQRWVNGVLRDGAGGFRSWSSSDAPGMDLSPWIGRSIHVGWLLWEDRWWAWFEGGWLGFYGPEQWESPPRVAGAVQWFGEVFFTRTPSVPMGNGRHASDTGAARFTALCSMGPGEQRCSPPRGGWPRVTDAARYGLVFEEPDRFRYGGPGDVRPRPPPSSTSEGTLPATGR